jgi:hypothetical protein
MARAERYPIGAPVRMLMGSEGKLARSRNMSESGIYVEHDGPVKVGEPLELVVYDERRSTIVRVTASIVRVESGGFGARFLTATPAGRTELKNFLTNYSTPA